MPTHKKSFRVASGPFTIEKVKTVSPAVEVSITDVVADASTDAPISVFVEATGLASFHLWADQAVTVKTNSTSTPQETFTLDGIDATSWVTGEGTAPIAGDVTVIYVTNASGNDATIKLLAGWAGA